MNASFFIRLKAFLYDYLLILGYIVLLIILSVFLIPAIQELFTGSLLVAQLAGFALLTLPVLLYFAICDSSLVGQSFGKRKMGISVIDDTGSNPTLVRSIFRNALKFLPWELSHYLVYRLVHLGDQFIPLTYTLLGVIIYGLMFTYILTAIFTKRKQSIYDMIVKTEVVKSMYQNTI
ncbi:RDD family protein [Bacillus marasmi]|uniref:RDD family protein n=1 Tax=Bacillus marasmi TaxID=1926279 RepID=UPI0011CA4F33|nr:RDD family protein [Bacillus marasmi]